jgi:hypothetical protein
MSTPATLSANGAEISVMGRPDGRVANPAFAPEWD